MYSYYFIYIRGCAWETPDSERCCKLQTLQFWNHNRYVKQDMIVKCQHLVGVENNIPVLWMHFLPFSQMTEAEIAEFQYVCNFMHKHKSMHNAIYSNGACIRKGKTTKKIIGSMYAAGWRGAQVPCMFCFIFMHFFFVDMFYLVEDFGVYKTKPNVDAAEWAAHIAQEPIVAAIYAKW